MYTRERGALLPPGLSSNRSHHETFRSSTHWRDRLRTAHTTRRSRSRDSRGKIRARSLHAWYVCLPLTLPICTLLSVVDDRWVLRDMGRATGDLVIIHGSVLHKSERNRSEKTRFAYTFHMIETPPHATYDEKNWLQPTKEMPFSHILDVPNPVVLSA